MYDGCPPADPRSNASLIPLSLLLSPLLPSLSLVCALFFSPSLSLSQSTFLSIVARVLAYQRALYGTAKRILTDWKPFTINAMPRRRRRPRMCLLSAFRGPPR